MGSVWKRLNRINKRASKFRFTVSYSELWLETGPNWQPTSLSVIWTRKSRRVVSDPVRWEPTMKNPYVGMCVWPVPENKEILVTMFRDPNKEEYDNKDWFFILEDVNPSGKRKPVAQGRLNMKDFSTAVPTKNDLTVKLRPISKKVSSAKLTMTLTAELLKEGKATDDDMRSIASLVSNSTLSGDYGNSLLKEVDEELPEETASATVSIKDEISSITKQFESLNKRASEEVGAKIKVNSRLSSPPPAPPVIVTPAKSSNNTIANEAVDENKNNTPSYTSPVSSFSDSNQKIKQIDILPGKDTNHRFKSTYNGPMGDYKHRTQPSADRNSSTAEEQSEEVSQQSSSVSSSEASSSATKPEPVLPPVPPRPDKTAETITVSATIETNPEVTTPVKTPEPSSPVKEIVESTPSKYQRTKSQEFRDYQNEFMVASIIDFGPLQPVNSSTPVSKPPAPRTVREPSPLSPVRGPPTPETSKTPSPEERSVSPPRGLSSCQKLDFENSKTSEVEFDVKATTNGDNDNTQNSGNNSKKKEIKPSNSFILDLNRNSKCLENDDTSSDSTPIVETKKTPAPVLKNLKIEKELSDRTNSLLRKNPTKTADDLLEWAKTTLSSYTNVKVTNFTTSWRNGLAFCGLIHSFYPDLIAYDTLTQHDIKHNCKLAFEAGEKLGIPRVIEPENMVIKRIPDKLAVITYLHQLRSALGQPETNNLYEKSKDEQLVPATGVRKSFSEGHISSFSRNNLNEVEKSDLETIEENPSLDIKPDKLTEYTKGAKTLIEQARSEDKDEEEEDLPDLEPTAKNNSSSPPKVIMRQKSNTPKSKKDNRLSYFDNEMQMLDAEQHEIDVQAAILDKRLRETSEDDQVLYDALLQQWFTLVNKKNALVKRQMQLNILKKEDNLDKKQNMLQEELRSLSEMEESRKTEDDRKREDLLLQELIELVNKRNELVMQRDEEERMLHDDEQLDEEITLPENNHLRNNRRDECKMQ